MLLTTKSGPTDWTWQRASSAKCADLIHSDADAADFIRSAAAADWRKWCMSHGKSTSRNFSECWAQNSLNRGTATLHSQSLSTRMSTTHTDARLQSSI